MVPNRNAANVDNRRFQHLIALLALLGSLTFACPARAEAGTEEIGERSARRLAQAWEAYWKSDYDAARRAAEGPAKSDGPSAARAMHLKARAALALGDQRSVRAAQEHWASLASAARRDPFAAARLRLGKALLLESRGQGDRAIRELNEVIKLELKSLAAVEAHIELARLLGADGKTDKALKHLDRAAWLLDYGESVGVPASLQKVFFAAVRQTREDVKSPGRHEFSKARGFQKAGKHRRALDLFTSITEKLPESPYAVRSDYQIGRCLVALGDVDKAIEHLQQFTAQAPAGPWRGQAFVALIDHFLERRADLDAASEQADLAESSLDSALRDADARESWLEVRFDLTMRIGVVALLEGRQKPAIDALQDAIRLTRSKVIRENLSRLVVAAESGSGIIPEDVRNGSEQAQLALSLGVVNLLVQDYDAAARRFERVAGTLRVTPDPSSVTRDMRPIRPMSRVGRSQTAFAIFGKALLLDLRSRSSKALVLFHRSMEFDRNGSWHDETLYRIASITEEAAAATEAAGDQANARDQGASRELTLEQRKELASKRRQRQRKILAGRAEALPHWRRIIQGYPESPRLLHALYGEGILLHELAEQGLDESGRPAREAALARLQDDALKAFEKICTDFPDSEQAGEAYRRRLDSALFRGMDLEDAEAVAPDAIQWVDKALANTSSLNQPQPPWPENSDRAGIELGVKRTAIECASLSGIVAYLNGEFDLAKKRAGKGGPKRSGRISNPVEFARMRLYFLIDAAKREKQVADQRALDATDDPRQKLILRLGCLYIEIAQPADAERALLMLTGPQSPAGRVPPEIQAYAQIRLATSLHRQREKRSEALVALRELVDRKSLVGTHWHGTAMFRLALFTSNQTRDPSQSLPVYREMLTKYPDHEKASIAALYYFIDLERAGRTDEAIDAGRSFLADYPDGHYRKYVKQRLEELTAAQANSTRKGEDE